MHIPNVLGCMQDENQARTSDIFMRAHRNPHIRCFFVESSTLSLHALLQPSPKGAPIDGSDLFWAKSSMLIRFSSALCCLLWSLLIISRIFDSQLFLMLQQIRSCK